MALWGRLGGNSDNHPDGNIAMKRFNAVILLWITDSANGGLTGAEALAVFGYPRSLLNRDRVRTILRM